VQRRPTHAAGFSLIEMLVVLFVVVLLTSLVSLNLDSGAGDRAVRQRLDTLLALAGLALDEAQDSGTDLGALLLQDVDERGEAVVRVLWRQRLRPGWRQPQDALGLFEPLEFPPGVELRLYLDGAAVPPLRPGDAAAVDERAPQWLFSASGETQSGELEVLAGDSGERLWRATWDALGRFDVYRGDDLESEDSYADAR
jgi:prepilin-type N-terminal cleavage/methylation domain-containing protein